MTENICFSVIFVFLCVIKLLLFLLSNKNLITFGAAARAFHAAGRRRAQKKYAPGCTKASHACRLFVTEL